MSFSAYLGHMLVLELVNSASPPWLADPVRWLLFFALTALMSYGSYRYIEYPLARLE